MPGARFNKEYWIACRDKDTKEMFRVRRLGRRVEINGRVYYESREHIFTDAVSGYFIPWNLDIKTIKPETIENFIKRIPVDLMSLPIRSDCDEKD